MKAWRHNTRYRSMGGATHSGSTIYDVFRDALHYAVAEHAKIGFLRDDAFHPSWVAAYRPSGEDEGMMKLYGIAYIEGHFLYGGYRYGQLCDAIVFAAAHPNL